jgi:hypothetical protein
MATKQDYDRVRELSALAKRYRDQIEENLSNPNALTELGARIALNNAELAEYIAIFHGEASSAKVETYLEERANKATQGDSDIIAKKAELEPRKFYEICKYSVKAHDVLLARIRDRLDYLSEENKRANIKDGRSY